MSDSAAPSSAAAPGKIDVDKLRAQEAEKAGQIREMKKNGAPPVSRHAQITVIRVCGM
jgi:hypothetical protein